MDLRRYLVLIWKWAWLLALCALLGGGAAYYTSLRATPMYEASSTLRISSPDSTGMSDYTALLTGQSLAQTYAQLLTKDPVLDGVIRSMELGMSTEELRKAVSVQTVRDTGLIEITVRHADPAMAQAVANEIPRIFVEQDRVMEGSRYATLKASLTAKMASLEEEMRELQAAIAAKKAAGAGAAGAGAEDTDLIMLQSDLERAQSNYATLLQSYGNVELAQAQSGSGVMIVAEARLPDSPVSPKKVRNTLLAAVVGAMLGLGVALLVEYLDDTIKTPDDVQAALGVVTLGAVARSRGPKGSTVLIPGQSSPTSSGVTSSKSSPQPPSRPSLRSPLAEGYRVVRTNLQFSDVDHPAKSLLVTSAGPGEGKSTTVANLGVVMAEQGQRVILVDTDLRRPNLHRLFDLPNTRGLTSMLVRGHHAMNGWAQETTVRNLRVITSGPLPQNPSELLGSERMQQLAARLRDEADVVLYDSPPVMAVTDAAVLAKHVDATLLVVDSAGARRGMAQQAMTVLRQVGAKVVGVVLNKVSASRGGYYYYYYSRYYRYGEDGDGERRRRRRESALRRAWTRLRRWLEE